MPGDEKELTCKEQSERDKFIRKQLEQNKKIFKVGGFVEIEGALFIVHKITKKGEIHLRRYTGKIAVLRADATGTMVNAVKA